MFHSNKSIFPSSCWILCDKTLKAKTFWGGKGLSPVTVYGDIVEGNQGRNWGWNCRGRMLASLQGGSPSSSGCLPQRVEQNSHSGYQLRQSLPEATEQFNLWDSSIDGLCSHVTLGSTKLSKKKNKVKISKKVTSTSLYRQTKNKQESNQHIPFCIHLSIQVTQYLQIFDRKTSEGKVG